MPQNHDLPGRLDGGGSEENSSQERGNANNEVNRRAFLGMGSLGATAVFAALGGVRAARGSNDGDRFDVEEVSIAELQAAMASGKVTAGVLSKPTWLISKSFTKKARKSIQFLT